MSVCSSRKCHRNLFQFGYKEIKQFHWNLPSIKLYNLFNWLSTENMINLVIQTYKSLFLYRKEDLGEHCGPCHRMVFMKSISINCKIKTFCHPSFHWWKLHGVYLKTKVHVMIFLYYHTNHCHKRYIVHVLSLFTYTAV